MGEKILHKLCNEFKLFGVWKIYEFNQSCVEYRYDIKDEELSDEIFWHEQRCKYR